MKWKFDCLKKSIIIVIIIVEILLIMAFSSTVISVFMLHVTHSVNKLKVTPQKFRNNAHKV